MRATELSVFAVRETPDTPSIVNFPSQFTVFRGDTDPRTETRDCTTCASHSCGHGKPARARARTRARALDKRAVRRVRRCGARNSTLARLAFYFNRLPAGEAYRQCVLETKAERAVRILGFRNKRIEGRMSPERRSGLICQF